MEKIITRQICCNYPSEWTASWESYESNRDKLVQAIKSFMQQTQGNWLMGQMQSQLGTLNKYIRSTQLMNSLLS